MVEVIHDIFSMQQQAERIRRSGTTIGLVPTMGSLHEGHLSLIRRARNQSDVVITTVFVNPTQFAPGEDFEAYPRNLERDVTLAHDAGTDYVFAPASGEVYCQDHLTYVTVDQLTSVLEGKFRPNHFRGVTTVVAKLFNVTRPHIAVFGQKDAQQVVVIRRMVRDLNIDVEIVVVPIVREPDGLAMSSRNVYLTDEQRREAPVLFHSLGQAQTDIVNGERSCGVIIRRMRELITSRSSAEIDYCSAAHGESLEELNSIPSGKPVLISLAARFGTTRLIDNIQFTVEKET
ncbi:MAG: pantoate--beta-alanine ligase [Ignavibacteria bacterium]|nr:pantoate--beta-alanine ligase [Ignavibacteria bacterium]